MFLSTFSRQVHILAKELIFFKKRGKQSYITSVIVLVNKNRIFFVKSDYNPLITNWICAHHAYSTA